MHVCCTSARALYASEAVSTATASPHYQQVAGTVRGEGRSSAGLTRGATLASLRTHPSGLSVCLSAPGPFNVSAYKGRQMMVGSTKSKTAYQTGYFGKTFDRIMEGEAYSDPVKQRRQNKLTEAQKNLSKAFVPSSVSKKA